MKKSRFTEEQIAFALRQAEGGVAGWQLLQLETAAAGANPDVQTFVDAGGSGAAGTLMMWSRCVGT